MHISEDHRKEAEAPCKRSIAGHISSDTLGMNLLLDNILSKDEVVGTSGFTRIIEPDRPSGVCSISGCRG
jgi:hypothetical protein